MANQKSISFTIFIVCSAIYARTAFLAPSKEEMEDEAIADKYQTYQIKEDRLGVMYGLRYYILGIGVIGLLITLEDEYSERSKKKAAKVSGPAPTSDEKPNSP